MSIWIAISLPESSYADKPGELYEYSTSVQNSRRICVGDILLIRNRDEVCGAGKISAIATKKRRIRRRTGELVDLLYYRARLSQWLEPRNEIDGQQLRAIQWSRSKQTAISEAKPVELIRYLRKRDALFADHVAQLASEVVADNDSFEELIDLSDEDDLVRVIKQRRGQKRFRNRLLKHYRWRCAISGCKALAVLEAAHISPYRDSRDNRSANGILLRADLHTLFDVFEIGIDENYIVRVGQSLRRTEYNALDGRNIKRSLSKLGIPLPSADLVAERWWRFQIAQQS